MKHLTRHSYAAKDRSHMLPLVLDTLEDRLPPGYLGVLISTEALKSPSANVGVNSILMNSSLSVDFAPIEGPVSRPRGFSSPSSETKTSIPAVGNDVQETSAPFTAELQPPDASVGIRFRPAFFDTASPIASSLGALTGPTVARPFSGMATSAPGNLVSARIHSIGTAKASPKPPSNTLSEADQSRVKENYSKSPIYFEANLGQTDESVKFISRGGGMTTFLTPTEAVMVLPNQHSDAREQNSKFGAGISESGPFRTGSDLSTVAKSRSSETQTGSVVRMQFVDANPSPQVTGVGQQAGIVNYFIGNDPSKWHANIPTYGKVEYQDVYTGIDLVFYGTSNQELEYDFVVAPGADPREITLNFAGADRLEIDATGELVAHASGIQLRQHKPVIYQELNGVRQEVTGSFMLHSNLTSSIVGFEIASYDATRPLIIDPVVGYSTYLGGSEWEEALGIAVDAAGSAYVTGTTYSTDLPTTAGSFDTSFNGIGDAFVTKLNAAGSALVYSTYLGGTSFDYGDGGIAVDSAGNAYVTGTTQSADFPVTPGAFDTSYNFDNDLADIFVTKLNGAGSALGYSTYVGGSSKDLSWGGIAVDSAGSAYITGQTLSPNFPTTPGAFDTTYNSNGKEDAFVTKLHPAGSALVYSTYLGGLEWDRGWGIAVDSAGHAYVSGYTISINFPTTEGAFDPSKNGGHDRYVTKLSIDGSGQVYSTFLGGSTTESGWGGIAVDSAGNAYVVTPTASTDFPTTAGAFDTTFNGFWDIAVTKFNGEGSALIYSTFIGGANLDYPYNMALDSAGNVYVSGETTSTNYPTTVGAFDTSYNGGTSDAFVTRLNGAGSALAYSTYLGGSDWDVGNSVAAGGGSAYVTGRAYSADFPTTAGAFDTSFNGGGSDAFVTKFSFPGKAPMMAKPVP